MAIGNTPHECGCGSRGFVEVFQVLHYAGGGSGRRHEGFKCSECGRIVGKDSFSAFEEKRRAEEQLREAQETLRRLEAQNGAEEARKTARKQEQASG